MRYALPLIALFLIGCQRSERDWYRKDMPPASAYMRVEDRLAALMLDWGIPWRFPCTITEKVGDTVVQSGLPTDQCWKMGPRKRFKGLWNDEFEGSRFCPDPAEQCSFVSRGEHIWLSFSDKLNGIEEYRPDGVYEIEFIGRQTLYSGLYGHMGGSDEEVIVDRIVAMKRIGDTPVISEAEFDAYVNGRLRDRDRDRAKRR